VVTKNKLFFKKKPLTDRNKSYIVVAMKEGSRKISSAQLDEKVQWFIDLCRKKGLKVTPQRVAVYRELAGTSKHPSAEKLHRKIKEQFPGISLDTVNRTLLMLADIGAAFVVEGSGDTRRFDAGMDNHQHFRCVRCHGITDFHHEPFDEIELPKSISNKFKVLRKTVYIEGVCDLCC